MSRIAISKCNRFHLLFGAALACLALSQPVAAQSLPQVSSPPVRSPEDQRGVNVVTGAFNYSHADAVIGGNESDLKIVRSWGGNGWRFNTTATLETATNGYKVSLGTKSESFTLSGSVYVSNEGAGGQLTKPTSTTFKYVAADGTVVNFNSNSAITNYDNINGAYSGQIAVPTSIIFTNGEKYTYTFDNILVCYSVMTSCSTKTILLSRLNKIQSSSGYAIIPNYQSSSAPIDLQNAAPWFAQTSLGLSNSSNNAGYTLTSSMSGSTETVNAVDGTWTYTRSATALTGIRAPGFATDNVTVAYTAGKVSSVTVSGIIYTYGYSDAGNVRTTTVTGPTGTRTVTSDIAKTLILSDQNELGQTTRFVYDSNGRMTFLVPPEGSVDVNGNPTAGYVKYTYDSRGNVTEQRFVSKTPGTPPDIVLTASFSASCTTATCNQPIWTKDAKGNQTDYTYAATHGGVLTVTAPADATGVRPQTRYDYSALQAYYRNTSGSIVASGVTHYKLTSISTCLTGASCAGTAYERKTTISYGPQVAGTANNLLPVSATVAAGDNSISATTTTAYDAVGNVQTVDGPLPGTADTVRYRYDGARRLVGTVTPDPDGAGNRTPTAERITYNASGQVSQTELGTVIDQSDTAWNNFSSVEQQINTYDSFGRPTKIETKAGGTTYAVAQQNYDPAGRANCIAQRMDPAQWTGQNDPCVPQTSGPNGPDRVVQTGYDALGRPTSVTQSVGTVGAMSESIAYTANGKVATIKDGENNLTTVEYDGIDRLKKTRYPVSAQGANASSTTDYEELSYDANSLVTQVRLRDSNTIGFTYDNLGRVSSRLENGSTTRLYGYDLLGGQTSASWNAGGSAEAYIYDALGRMTARNQPYGSLTYQYDVAGRRTRMTWADGLFIAYDFDLLNNVTAIRENGATSGVGVLATYSYDSLGRRTGVTRGNSTTASYAFDPVSRLSSLTQNLTGTANDLTIGSITYNPASQIVSQAKSNDAYAWSGHYNVNRNYTVNGLNQQTVAGTTALSYDARGNLTQSGSTTYTYDLVNNLTGWSGGLYMEYGARDQLQGYGNTRFAYDGAQINSEWNWTASGPPTLLRRYVPGPWVDEPVVWYEGTGTTDRRWLHADERGSAVAVSDGSGAMLAINRYDEYGIPQSGNSGRFQYTGQAWLPELGMSYYKARMYSPTLGRFMQTDPIGYGDGLNWYNYVGSDPVNRVDPTGLDILEIEVNACRTGGQYDPYSNACVGTSAGCPDGYVKINGGCMTTWQLAALYSPYPRSGSASPAAAPQNGFQRVSDRPNLCDRRRWHNTKASERVAELRAAGFLVATNVALSLIGPNGEGYNGPGWAVADYIAYRPEPTARVFYIGEVKTGGGALTRRQMQHYGTGFAQVRGNNGIPIGLVPGEIFPVVFTGVDLFPGCPAGN